MYDDRRYNGIQRLKEDIDLNSKMITCLLEELNEVKEEINQKKETEDD